MTAVAIPPDYERKISWQSSPQSLIESIQLDDTKVERMLLRKSAQRAGSSSSIASNSSSSSSGSDASDDTLVASKPLSQMNGGLGPAFTHDNTNGPPNPNIRIKKAQRMWPNNKADTPSLVSSIRSQTPNTGNSAGASMSMSMGQANGITTSQLSQSQTTLQQTAARQGAQTGADGNPLLYLLSMNSTFERKTISVPIYPEVLRIGRQTNQKTLPTPQNGYFDSKVLSRQHAEVWAERNGKVWIRDVRSSNGTFVNGTRLSAENRDSEPHELQSQDHLELGIDIVSEDQKTVVHHKVAAKVEHAGFAGSTTNVLDMSFGDLDPTHSVSMVPSQNGIARGRNNSQPSVNNINRLVTPGNTGVPTIPPDFKRPMNFWLTPVTTESIVRRLHTEMREARRQNVDLEHAAIFVNQLAEGIDLKIDARTRPQELPKSSSSSPSNGGSVSLKRESLPRFSDPPAPPPKQPLPEKPDMPRQSSSDPQSPSLRRTHTEKPVALSMSSPSRPIPDLQMTSLVEALHQARKEIDAQASKLKNLETLLYKERQARETAESVAKSLETVRDAHLVDSHNDSTTIVNVEEIHHSDVSSDDDPTLLVDVVANSTDAETATVRLQDRLDSLLAEMQDMKQHMERYRQRAETAEKERDEDRRSLAQMVFKLREQTPSSNMETSNGVVHTIEQGTHTEVHSSIDSSPNEENAERFLKAEQDSGHLFATLRPPSLRNEALYQSTPYVSMLGVVLLGMGVMAFLNGKFHKSDG